LLCGRHLNRIHVVRNHLILCMLVGFVLLAGCKSSRPGDVRNPTNVRHVSLRIFEVVDCSTGMVPMSLKGGTEKYCLSAKPMVDETDIRGAEAEHGKSGRVLLNLYLTIKAGEHLRDTTERIVREHPRENDPGRVGIVVDGTLVEAPELRGAIADAVTIDGVFSWEEAVQIADSIMGRR